MSRRAHCREAPGLTARRLGAKAPHHLFSAPSRKCRREMPKLDAAQVCFALQNVVSLSHLTILASGGWG